jgi:hypothetical protein
VGDGAPRGDHPLIDTVGTKVAQGQVDPVWFIGGVFGSQLVPWDGQAERTVTIPGDVALFFPIINTAWDNQVCVGPGWAPRTAAELAELAFTQVNGGQDIYCIIDGVQVIDAASFASAENYRAISGTFTYSMPDDNVGAYVCGDPPGARVVTPAVSDGIWMMLKPMPAGSHELRFGGRFPLIGGGFFGLDVVYHITVLP